MAISEAKMQMVIANYFKDECDVNTSIRQAFEKGFRIGVKKGASTNRPQEWIPCSERLPDLNENGVSDMVLLCWSDGQMTVGAYQGGHTFVGQAWPTARDCRVTVTAWQPLPTPWKGADDEV